MTDLSCQTKEFGSHPLISIGPLSVYKLYVSTML